MYGNENPDPIPEEESIFTENEFSTEGYDKHIKNARNILFGVAVVQLITALVSIYLTVGRIIWVTQIISITVAIIFFILGLWTKSKPYTAILLALTIYIGLWIADSIYDASYIYRAIFIKVIIIVYLVMGLRNAKVAQEMTRLNK